MKKKLLFICISTLLLVACKNEATIIGSKQEGEKCNASAGYQWSTIKNDCIRIFEQNYQLRSVLKVPMETTCAFVFNEKNDMVEVFSDTVVILTKKSTDNFEGAVSSKNYNLKKKNGIWQLTIDDILIYTE
jgi:hypothetical protein